MGIEKSNLILFRALERIETHCAAAILKNDDRHSLGNRALFLTGRLSKRRF